MTYFEGDHRERKNVRFLGKLLPLQDLWCSPSRAVATLKRGAPDGIQVLGERGEAKVREARTTRVIHKDVQLAECEYCGK